MKKCVLLAILMLMGCEAGSAATQTGGRINGSQENNEDVIAVRAAIEEYFDLIYKERSTGITESFRHLIADTKTGQELIATEQRRREIDLYSMVLYNNLYKSYRYWLEYQHVEVSEQTAEAHLLEHNRTRSFHDPSVESALGGLEHVFALRKDSDGRWLIERDDYETILTKALDQGEPIEIIKARIKEQHDLDQQTSLTYEAQELQHEAVPKTLWWSWSPERTVGYARHWALSANPEYADFSEMGGDCTNFVSQAIRAGGNRSDTIGIIDRNKWYYNNINDRSPSWTGVNQFYLYLTRDLSGEEAFEGPMAYMVSREDAEPGDIIQMKWSLFRYDHTVIITKIKDGRIYYSGHSTPRLDYDLSRVRGIIGFRFIAIAVMS